MAIDTILIADILDITPKSTGKQSLDIANNIQGSTEILFAATTSSTLMSTEILFAVTPNSILSFTGKLFSATTNKMGIISGKSSGVSFDQS
ncbi:hypothetical protein J6590_080489 [Homalodisca vitripennis]|nr:hypothetical protein J6590_080489 [Homalodisca vitripennis]